jgi:hypothetical protein
MQSSNYRELPIHTVGHWVALAERLGSNEGADSGHNGAEFHERLHREFGGVIFSWSVSLFNS